MTDKNSKDGKNADENVHDEEKKISKNIIIKEALIESGSEENDDFANNDDANYFEHRNEEVNEGLNNEGDILNIAEEKKINEDL